jgi:hypothetical protein
MPRLFLPLVLTAIFAFPATSVFACEFVRDSVGGPQSARLGDIEPGIASGTLSCGKSRYPAQFWTLAVDSREADLGVRDGKLFDPSHTGPLTELVSARIEKHARVSVHERSETVAMSRSPMPSGRHSFRRFVTFCDLSGNDDPLDCSLGAARLKARATAQDANRDGYPDISMHEISFYDGKSRLHVMSFVTPYAESLTVDIGTWIEAINAVSDALKPRELASAD